jgi:hypothetical protein
MKLDHSYMFCCITTQVEWFAANVSVVIADIKYSPLAKYKQMKVGNLDGAMQYISLVKCISPICSTHIWSSFRILLQFML